MNQRKKKTPIVQDEKIIRKEKLSMSLRAQWKAWYESCLEYFLETSVSTLHLVNYYNGSKYKRYLIERSEIRPFRTAIVRLPNSVEHNRNYKNVLSIDHSISEHLFADYFKGQGKQKQKWEIMTLFFRERCETRENGSRALSYALSHVL